MRKSNVTNTLVLVSNNVTSIYSDRWTNNVLHYTGMGQTGDQDLTQQNRTLAESPLNGIRIFLFEVFCLREYTYVGEVTLDAKPYKSRQLDRDQKERQVWIFPLRLITPIFIPDRDTVEKPFLDKLKTAHQLDEAELRARATLGDPQPGKRLLTATQFTRSPWVAEAVKRRARGICEACQEAAPFASTTGEPYLEVHHITPLSEGGFDTMTNTAAICPNCHRRCHHASDKAAYTRKLQESVDAKESNWPS